MTRAGTGDLYAPTRKLQEAIKGRETDVLDALNIDWRKGNPHITCPYPTHGGAADWRWDARVGRARCTCTRGDSIFDVTMKVKGLDFDRAKLYVAQAIGRNDLILARNGHQPMNAAALLRPRADQRADSLPQAYLAHRLGVDREQAPMPTTPVAGWHKLPYFDPPSSKRGKARLVGHFPCAVFGTVGADGRHHGHRLYVASHGAGKADLGTGPDGHPRDPKKAAVKANGDQSMSGCAVLWGDRESATWCVVCEGIETGAAIALAFRAEVDAGEVLIAAAISAGGVEAFTPWPAAQRITVAADRDEGEKPSGKLGSRRGEAAARALGFRLYPTMPVIIAMPGRPGEPIDWLDVLRRDGIDAVRKELLAAEAFSPTPLEIEDAQRAAFEKSRQIRCYGGSLPQNVADAERLLAEATCREPAYGVYQRGGVLTRIARLPVATTADGIRRAAGSLQILTAGPDYLRLRLTEIATWLKFDKRSGEWVPTDAPAGVARTLADMSGMWPHTRNLAGIIEAPAMRPDGSIIARAGYDAESGLYLDPGDISFPAIPERPVRRDAVAALDLLLEITAGFPFVDEPSKAVALALLITPLIRHAVRAAPLTAISAPKMGSGKTLLSHLPAYIATGRPPALMAQADDPNAEKKRLLALLLEGSPVTVLDNCERPLKSDALCTALTETTIRDRVLGSTRTISVPTSTAWLCTGNNLRIDGDLSSRALLCTLDPQCERPEEREFEIDLHVDVPRRRGQLAVAALTIVKAYLAAGAPRQNIPNFGRFEAWSRFTREPLVWLGMADPCETRRTVEARDLVRDKLGNLLETWRSVFGGSGETVAAAIKATEQEPVREPPLRRAAGAAGRSRGHR
jgi:Toprim domain